MILPGLVYKFACLPPISAHFLPQSNSGWSFSCRSQRGLAATILKRQSHLLLLQYKCKYGHLRTAGLWIMEAGCPWFFCGRGEKPATQKQRESSQPHSVLLFSCVPILHMRLSDAGQKWDSSSNAAGCYKPLLEFPRLLYPFFLKTTIRCFHFVLILVALCTGAEVFPEMAVFPMSAKSLCPKSWFD